jgi:hypothetical protein
MIVDKGEDVGWILSDGREVNAPRSAGLLHDPEGHKWPKCSFLVMTYRRSTALATDDERSGYPKNYFGKDYEACVSIINTPPKSNDEWDLVGEVKKIFYWRPGRYEGTYKHEINKPRGIYRVMFWFKGKGKATLFKRGRAYRMDLSPCKKAVADDRGLVFP